MRTTASGPPTGRRSGPDDVAFLTYTSGTTGPPKGAMNMHGNVVFNSRSSATGAPDAGRRRPRRRPAVPHHRARSPTSAVALLRAHAARARLSLRPGELLDLIELHRATFSVGAITAYIALMNDPSWRRPRPLVADQGVQRRGPDPAGRRRGASSASRHVHPQRLRPDRDHVAVARRPLGAGAGRPDLGRAVGRRADLQHRGAGRRRGRQRPAAGEVGEFVTSGPQVVRRLLEQAGGDRARAA